ncbi:MAG TPA: carbohydrate ABC transporter permease [Candidatus Limnocylindrales bacterium]
MKLGGKVRRHRDGWTRSVFLAVALLVVLVPLAWTALAAIGIQPNNATSPPSWIVRPTLDHLAEVSVVEPAFWQELATSLGVSAVAALLSAAISFLAAFGLARSGGPAARRFTPGLLVLASLQVMAYVLPLSDMLRRLGLLDTLPGITFAEAASTAPLAVYVFYAYLVGASHECEEAARLDGAGLSGLLRDVVLPAAAPIVGATLIVLFVLDWNQLLKPLVLTGINVRTLPVVLTDFFTLERELDWPTAAAALTISLVPLLMLVTLFHRFLERFSLAGATPREMT